MKILLLNPNDTCSEIMGAGKLFVIPAMPMGLLSIGASLEKKGYSVKFRDCYLNDDTPQCAFEIIKKEEPDILAVTCLTANSEFVYRLGKLVKESKLKTYVILGNIHASEFSDFFLKNNVCDIVVHGEGEYTCLEILSQFTEKNFDSIKGISFLKNGRPFRTAEREIIKNIDSLPHYIISDLNIKDYLLEERLKEKMMPVLTSRGCVNRCRFCNVHNQRNYRVRKISDVIDEIRYFKEKYGVTFIDFIDSLFTVYEDRTMEMCEEIMSKNLNIKWHCSSHINFLSEKLVKKMADSGCCGIALGIESGNQELVNKISKNISLVRAREVVNYVSKYIYDTQCLFILGIPGETEDTLNQTIQYACSLPIKTVQFTMFVPYPGSDYYYELLKSGDISNPLDFPEEMLKLWKRYSSYTFFKNVPPIYTTPGLTPEKLIKYHKKAFRKFYFRPGYIIRHGNTNWRTKNLNLKNFTELIGLIKSAVRLFI
ncbi:radical SAM protein [Candidatus Dependentiae bacterium]|nr:radical SAM protein [Candidatus Dependentiae bacterium]